MYLKVKDLKNFASLSGAITPNTIIPVLAYWKLEEGSLCKTNLNTYVVHKVDVPKEETLLLDEKVISAFLKDCKAEQIEVKVDGTNVYLVDGKRKMRYQSASIKDFPVLPDAKKEDAVDFDADVLSSLGVAAKNTASTGLNSPFDFVHVNEGYVIATDNHKIYFRKVSGIPNLILTPASCNILAQFQNAVFYTRGKYNFFEVGDTLFGFIQTESKTPNFSKVIPQKQAEEYLDIQASEFISFCDTVMAASPSKDLDAKFNGNQLKFVNSEIDFEYETELKTEGTFKPDISFLPKLFGSYFKSLGISTIRLCDSGLGNKSLSVWDLDDFNYVGLVIGTMEQ